MQQPYPLAVRRLTLRRLGLVALLTVLFCAVKTPVDDSRYGPRDQSDTPGE
jgi:hypothetical protein